MISFSNSQPTATSSALVDSIAAPLNSLESHPEASSYLHLSCDESICERINQSIEELDFPEFFTA